MKRRTLDILFSFGGLGLAALLLVAGVVLKSNADFANSYVTSQLREQRITFKSLDTLTDEEKAAPCIVANAGKVLSNGKQAECYANHFIGLHLVKSGGGKTYAELGDVQTGLRAQVAEAQKTGATELPALQKQLTDVTAQRETVFKGETLRGLLLTSYGFSVFGVKGGQFANVAFTGGALMLLLTLAGFVHAFRTPASQPFAAAVPGRGRREEPATV
jgi:hypothetical protein